MIVAELFNTNFEDPLFRPNERVNPDLEYNLLRAQIVADYAVGMTLRFDVAGHAKIRRGDWNQAADLER